MPDPFVRDPAGGLMVLAPAAKCYVGWVPVTKLQYEEFLCDDPGEVYNGAFYEALLRAAPTAARVHPGGVRADNFWLALVTALLPEEARAYAAWCGDEYLVPTKEQWLQVYDDLRKRPGVNLEPVLAAHPLTERARELLTRLDAAAAEGYERANKLRPGEARAKWSLADQMLLRGGVFEWVETRSAANRLEWAGLGQPAAGLGPPLFNLDNRVPHPVRDAGTVRQPWYGFRLLRRVD